MVTDVFRENRDRFESRERSFIGGAYGARDVRILGHHPIPFIAIGVDAVILDSRTPSTKLYSTQTFPLTITDEKDIDAGTDFSTQVVIKFDRPIDRVRSIAVPFRDPRHFRDDTPVASGAGLQEIVGSLLLFLLRAGLDSGTFKLEDLTYTLAHAPDRIDSSTSTLFATASNFRGFLGGGPTAPFTLFPFSTDVNFSPSFGHNLTRFGQQVSPDRTTPLDMGAALWFYDAGGGVNTIPDGDAGPFTGILLLTSPPGPGGGNPGPATAGELARLRYPLPDPKPGAGGLTEGRFPYGIGLPVAPVVDE